MSAIAETCDCTRQNVSRMLSVFSKYDVSEEKTLENLPAEAFEISLEILSHKRNNFNDLSDAIEDYSRRELATVLNVLQGRRTYYDKQDTAGYYSALNEWRSETNTSIHALAEKAGISTVRLQAILAGKLKMPYEYAAKLSKITGLTISEIYDDARQISEILQGPTNTKGGVR